MERITDQRHSKSAFSIAFSKMFERASYYGIKAVTVLYLISETINMERSEALQIYALFTGGIMISGFIGGFLGDLLVGNRKAVILGGFLQIIGGFTMCSPSQLAFYIGLGLFIIGGGLFNPNLTSLFSKTYLDREKLLDAGFSLFHLMKNFGAFIGIVSVGYIGENFGWNLGFVTAGAFSIISLLFAIFSKEIKIKKTKIHKFQSKQKILYVAIAFMLMGFFWTIYELGNYRISDLNMAFAENDTVDFSMLFLSSISFYSMVPIGISLIIIWTYFYSRSIVKLIIGFMIGAVAFGLLIFIPEIPLDGHIYIFILSMVCLSLAELFIGPIVFAFAIKYTNPKYYAIVVGLTFIPNGLFYFLMNFSNFDFSGNPVILLKYCTIALAVISVGLMIFTLTNREPKSFVLLDS